MEWGEAPRRTMACEPASGMGQMNAGLRGENYSLIPLPVADIPGL
jgi:hypothetical protein